MIQIGVKESKKLSKSMIRGTCTNKACKCENQEHQEKQKGNIIETIGCPDFRKIEHEYKWTPEEKSCKITKTPSHTDESAKESLLI